MIRAWMVVGIVAIVMGCSGSRPARLGVAHGLFASCPDSKNCVSSQAFDRVHAISPLSYEDAPEAAWKRLLSVVGRMERARIVTEDDHYLHVEFTSQIFRFVDDAEFLLDEKSKVIHVRSAARLGYYDFGVNRKRVETIRELFAGAS